MKKSVAILLSLVVLVSAAFASCSSKDEKETTTTTEQGLDNGENEYGLETVDVTDKDGKTVTDKKGNTVTTEVAVKYEKDKKGNTVAKVLDKEGNAVTDKKGNEVTIKTDYKITTKKATGNSTTAKTTKPTKTTTATTKGNEKTTQKEITTVAPDKDKVPTIENAIKSKDKETVTFSSKDQQVLKSMLEVPYLYKSSYENKNGVPIAAAAHAALWMAEREGLNTSSYASGTIVLDLFKFFGQTVVNFKSKCNENSGTDNIVYNSGNDTFSISSFESKKQNVSITKVEYLGNNNYYLVTGTVTGAGDIDTVYAIMQKNKLDSSLGFSVKALKWK